MPIYEFHCDACDTTFDHMTTMDARDKAAPCPTCKSKKTGRKLSVITVGAPASNTGPSPSGHAHSGMCGCGKRPGSCGMN